MLPLNTHRKVNTVSSSTPYRRFSVYCAFGGALKAQVRITGKITVRGG